MRALPAGLQVTRVLLASVFNAAKSEGLAEVKVLGGISECFRFLPLVFSVLFFFVPCPLSWLGDRLPLSIWRAAASRRCHFWPPGQRARCPLRRHLFHLLVLLLVLVSCSCFLSLVPFSLPSLFRCAFLAFSLCRAFLFVYLLGRTPESTARRRPTTRRGALRLLAPSGTLRATPERALPLKSDKFF